MEAGGRSESDTKKGKHLVRMGYVSDFGRKTVRRKLEMNFQLVTISLISGNDSLMCSISEKDRLATTA